MAEVISWMLFHYRLHTPRGLQSSRWRWPWPKIKVTVQVQIPKKINIWPCLVCYLNKYFMLGTNLQRHNLLLMPQLTVNRTGWGINSITPIFTAFHLQLIWAKPSCLVLILISILITLFFYLISWIKECNRGYFTDLINLDVGILMDIDKEVKTIPKNVHVTLKMNAFYDYSKDLNFDKVLHRSLQLPCMYIESPHAIPCDCERHFKLC